MAPFKPQNMALNSAVTEDGGEIGRAQAFQAEASGVAPHTDMNPVLLKPCTDTGAQVIVNGKPIGNMDARTYHAYKPHLRQAVMSAYDRLCRRYDWVIVEGAGSPAEINLRSGDIANMGFAQLAGCPVVLVADIDRGGVFAHIYGTTAVLDDIDRQHIAGFIINKFRGDKELLASGIAWIEEHTGRPIFGVVPYIRDLRVDAEDSLSRPDPGVEHRTDLLQSFNIAVPLTPHTSNDTDLNSLIANTRVRVSYVRPGMRIRDADLVILLGSKSVAADLAYLREQGWDDDIYRHLRYRGKLIGICGGFQMLGQLLHDPHGIETSSGSSVPGLGLLDMETTLTATKTLANVKGHLSFGSAASVEGYRIHMGRTSGAALARPSVIVGEDGDGAVSSDDLIVGTYVHGIFDNPEAHEALLQWAGLERRSGSDRHFDFLAERQKQFDSIADSLEENLDWRSIFELPLELKKSLPPGA